MKTKSIKTEILKIRISPIDKARIQMIANQFAEGNLSKWILHAALCLKLRRPLK